MLPYVAHFISVSLSLSLSLDLLLFLSRSLFVSPLFLPHLISPSLSLCLCCALLQKMEGLRGERRPITGEDALKPVQDLTLEKNHPSTEVGASPLTTAHPYQWQWHESWMPCTWRRWAHSEVPCITVTRH